MLTTTRVELGVADPVVVEPVGLATPLSTEVLVDIVEGAALSVAAGSLVSGAAALVDCSTGALVVSSAGGAVVVGSTGAVVVGSTAGAELVCYQDRC